MFKHQKTNVGGMSDIMTGMSVLFLGTSRIRGGRTFGPWTR